MKMSFLIAVLVGFMSVGNLSGQDYDIKKVPSFPLNLQKLSSEIFEELQQNGGKIEINDRVYFSLDPIEPTVMEFMAYKAIARSGERSCKFMKFKDGNMYFPRRVDYETSKDAQGNLYNEMKDKWERYLSWKERQEK